MGAILDRTQPFGTSLGHNHVHFLQNNKLFDKDGNEINESGELVGGITKAPEQPKPVEPVVYTGNGRGQQIVEAIEMLEEGNSAHFTGQGVPRVDALEELLGFEITAQERNEAWAKF